MSPGRWPSLLLKKSGRVPVRNEADVVAVGLVRDGQAAIPGLGAYVGLAGRTERKVGPAKLITVEYAQHVRLVLGGVDGPMQLDVAPGTDQAGRSDPCRPHRSRARRHGPERPRT